MKPTGVIKPTDPKVESVVDSIKTQAGMTTPAEPIKTGATAATAAPAAATTASAPVKAAVLPKVNAAPTAPVTVTDLPTIEASTPVTPDPSPRPRASAPQSQSRSPMQLIHGPIVKTPDSKTPDGDPNQTDLLRRQYHLHGQAGWKARRRIGSIGIA